MYTLSKFASTPDARGLWTAALQRAIDTCHANGGGRVAVPAITSYCGHGRAELRDITLSGISAPDLGYLFDIEANNAPICDLTLCDMQLCGMAQASAVTREQGTLRGLTLRHLTLRLLPEREELTARRREKRGEDMLLLSGVQGAWLEDVCITSDPDTRETWQSSFKAERCEGVTCVRCKLEA